MGEQFLKLSLTLKAKLLTAQCPAAPTVIKSELLTTNIYFKIDQINCKSLYIKAEALFNLCYFEHALLLFHRGQVRSSKNYREIYKMI